MDFLLCTTPKCLSQRGQRKVMKRILAFTTLMALSTAGALAADLPSHKEPPVLPPPPPPMWTGFYVGLNAGGTWSDSNSLHLSSGPIAISPGNPGPNPSAPTDYAVTASLVSSGTQSAGSAGGFTGGGQVGYGYRMGSFVGGIEADIQGVAGSGGGGSVSRAIPVLGANQLNHAIATTFSARGSLDYLGTVRGRIGYLVIPTLLVYGTGGFAYGGVNLNVGGISALLPSVAGFDIFGPGFSSFSGTQTGWTAGGGLEWMFMPSWSAKVEYLYYDLGSARANVGITTVTLNGGLLWSNATTATARFNGNIVRAGLNYHFNWGAPAPVVAKY
jgi:outer membrane immunogenic protein